MGTPLYAVYAPRRGSIVGRVAGLAVLAAVVTACLVGLVSLADSPSHAASAAATHVVKPVVKAHVVSIKHHAWQRPPARTPVIVLNANGVKGAATSTAAHLRTLGYPTPKVADAGVLGVATAIQYRPGYARSARTLAGKLGVTQVGPLDGIRPAQLGAAVLVLLVGR